MHKGPDGLPERPDAGVGMHPPPLGQRSDRDQQWKRPPRGPQDEDGAEVRTRPEGPRAWRCILHSRGKLGSSPALPVFTARSLRPAQSPRCVSLSSLRSHATVLIDFRERKGERDTDQLPPLRTVSPDHTRNPGGCPGQGWNPQHFDLLANAPINWATRPGQPPPKSPQQLWEPQRTGLGPTGLGPTGLGGAPATTLMSLFSSSPGGPP